MLATSTFAQTNFPEIEPNSVKAEATAVTGIVPGDTITGTTTGTTTTAGSTLLTSVDMYRVKTTALPLGIYQHRLTLTTATATKPTGSIRGLNQTGATGTASTGGTAGTTDTQIQASSTATTPATFNQWYGFGRQEELYYRVAGTTATTAAYTATMSTSTVPFTVVTQAFESSSPITITTIGQAVADTDIHVFDSGLNAIAGFDNDDEGPVGPTLQSRIIRTFAPGTYYLAVGRSNTAWNIPFPPDEDFPSGIMDFPDSLVCASTTPTSGTDDRDFLISAANGALATANLVTAPDSYSVQWFQFTTMVGAPPIVTPPPANDNCASATALPVTSTSQAGTMLGATNDGAASCDPGGAASKDVWYSFTNSTAGVKGFSATLCGSTGVNDTVLSVYNSCGGTELACNDDNAGCAAQPLTSSVTGILVNPSQTIVIRVSDKGLGSTSGNFTLITTVANPPPPNDDCSTPTLITGTLTPFNTDGATTGSQGQTESLCNFIGGTAIARDQWFTYSPTASGTVTVTTCSFLTTTDQDTKIAVYAGTGCPTAGTAIACNDDDGVCASTSTLNSTLTFTATCGTSYTIQVGHYAGTANNSAGQFSVSIASPVTCSTPSTPECIGDTAAACPCSGAGGSLVPNPGAAGNGCANSSFPAGANLSSSGIAVDNAGDTLVLTCSGMPGPGLFFQSNSLGGPFVNFNDGILCAAVGIIRMGVVFPDGGGNASYPGGLTPAPIHIAGAPVLTPTPTKHYQCWYRDITPGFCNTQGHNMSNGLAITWSP